MAAKDLRTNEGIRVREVRLIDDDSGEQAIVPTTEALKMAQEKGVDLVEVAPQAKPPVCKLLDYGKYKFEQEKKNREAKKNQKQVKLKEVRMQPKIEQHDLQFKTKHIRQFLDEGFKVKVTVRFRGREMAHTELGKAVLERVMENLEGAYHLDRSPAMEGRFMSIIVSPASQKQKK
ncbi:MAG: translation initiation factor IF-3 [Spirochaetota bacterium]